MAAGLTGPQRGAQGTGRTGARGSGAPGQRRESPGPSGGEEKARRSLYSDTSEDTAAVAEILYSKTAHARGALLTGTMPNNGAVSGTISTKDQQYTVPQGYHDGSGVVQIASVERNKLIPGNIKAGIQLLGVTGNYSGEAVSVQAKTATPAATSQTILPDTGYDYLSQVTVEAIPYVETANAYGTTVTIG